MKQTLIVVAASLLLGNCATHRVLTPEEQMIPDYYRYLHSWDYPSPDGEGTIHCDEHGTIDFRPDGTYSDTAWQICYVRKTTDSVFAVVNLLYACQGHWKVENHKFLFNEMAEDFTLDLVPNPICYKESASLVDSIHSGEDNTPTEHYYAPLIKKHNTPDSKRWFSFDIRRLDRRWFVWTYTYPDGRVDSWDMKRTDRCEKAKRHVTPWHK